MLCIALNSGDSASSSLASIEVDEGACACAVVSVRPGIKRSGAVRVRVLTTSAYDYGMSGRLLPPSNGVTI